MRRLPPRWQPRLRQRSTRRVFLGQAARIWCHLLRLAFIGSTLLLTPLPRRQNLSAESVRWGRRGLVRWSHGRHASSNIMGDGTSSVKSALNMRGRCTQRRQRSRRWQQRAAPAVVVADGAGREGGRRRRRRSRETGRKRRQA